MDTIQENEILDVTGLTCPKPLLYTKKKLANMQSQTILKVLLDDKKSLEDFTFFCNATGHSLLKVIDNNLPIILYIKAKLS